MIVSASERPTTSARGQPKSRSACELHSMIWPSPSIEMNASCEEARIDRASSSRSRILLIRKIPVMPSAPVISESRAARPSSLTGYVGAPTISTGSPIAAKQPPTASTT